MVADLKFGSVLAILRICRKGVKWVRRVWWHNMPGGPGLGWVPKVGGNGLSCLASLA